MLVYNCYMSHSIFFAMLKDILYLLFCLTFCKEEKNLVEGYIGTSELYKLFMLLKHVGSSY